jgi:hypothetical protein
LILANIIWASSRADGLDVSGQPRHREKAAWCVGKLDVPDSGNMPCRVPHFFDEEQSQPESCMGAIVLIGWMYCQMEYAQQFTTCAQVDDDRNRCVPTLDTVTRHQALGAVLGNTHTDSTRTLQYLWRAELGDARADAFLEQLLSWVEEQQSLQIANAFGRDAGEKLEVAA